MIGGILRNVLSPVLSGGCVIACSGFDPLLFWDVLFAPADEGAPGLPVVPLPTTLAGYSRIELDSVHDLGLGSTDISSALRVTWYYAAPTMHHAILLEAEIRAQQSQGSGPGIREAAASIRFIANAAGFYYFIFYVHFCLFCYLLVMC